MKNMRIGFIGAGKMALALARGFAEKMKPNAILASSPASDEVFLKEFRSHGFDTYHSNEFVARNVDTVILATKPSILPTIFKELHDTIQPNQLLISIAAGIPIKMIQESLSMGDTLKVIRVMPNTPSLVNEGVSIYSLNHQCDLKDQKIIEEMFSCVGSIYKIDETLIDAATGISGCGPGYMYLVIEAMGDAGVKQGLPRDLAYKLAAQTMIGSGKMVLQTGQHPAVLKDSVCSAGGSTIAGISALENEGVRGAFIKAVEVATLKCKDLGNK
ncbi:pyrroline-5-carboxylate reductase 2 [Lepeophtheirus salmonis]|nr:pyrroline-5-carboxylate reductase 2-like [Lepeophtheirus salmonis]XP_040566742.1 pyrroline-5-carboxylate reductase 2-like [Lepeophtheirus salmonis]